VSVVEGRGLSKSYGEIVAVDGIDFDVRERECFGFLGPNGAGKTTTMKMIYGLASVGGGSLRVLGMDVAKELTTRENLEMQARFHGVPADGRIDELLRTALLEQRASSKPRELSGGMQRRLLIARALVNEPQLIVLDEPTTGLDPQARLAVWQRLEHLKQGGVTLILTTHYMEEAERICDRLAIMDEGKIVAEGSPRELCERYAQPNLEAVFLEITGHGLRE
jgi:lipooligosaccharide transport system ATP-binding protein